MRKRESKLVRAVTGVLAALLLLGGAALADGAGTQSDPLVTVSYLNQTVIPAILTQIDGKAETYRQQLVDELEQTVQDYSERMEAALAGQTGQSAGGSSTYAVVTLTKGQVMKLDVGCEVMLRIGTAQCLTPSSPGLIDVTTGQAVNNGADLTVNHLCMATISGRSVKATANTVKVLARGGYTVG